MKLKIVAIVFIIIFVGSTIAGALLSSFFYGTEKKETELPKTSIIDYELTQEQENLLKQNGKTIIKFRYSLACTECLKQKQFFESLVNVKEFAGQITLEEIKDNAITDFSKVTVASYLGEQDLSMNFTQDEVVDTICDYIFQKPTFCLVKDV